MYLNKIYIKNFMAVSDPLCIDLTDKPGFVIIKGANGTGKSSSFRDAPLWALTGTSRKGIINKQVINWEAKEGTCVSLEATLKDGQTLKVVRYKSDPVEKDNFKFQYGDGGGTDGLGTNTISTDVLTKALGFGKTALKGVLLAGSGSDDILSKTDDALKKLIESLINVEVYQKAFKVQKKLRDELKTKTGMTFGRLDAEMARERTLKANVESELKKLNSVKISVPNIHPKVKAHSEELYQELISTNSAERVSLQKEISKDLKILKGLQSDRAKFINEYKAAKSAIEKVLSDGTCPLCFTELGDHNNQSAVEHSEKLESQISKIQIAGKANSEKIKRVTEKLEGLQSALSKVEHRIDEIERNKREWERLRLEEEMRLRVSVDTSNLSKYEGLLEDTQSRIAKLRVELETYKRDKALAEFFMVAYSAKGLRMHLLETLIPILNKSMNDYMGKLTSNMLNLYLIPKVDKKGVQTGSVQFMIKKDGREIGVGSCSEGERTKASIAIALALSEYAEINTIIFDEPFQALDPNSVKVVSDVLRDASKNKRLLIITHQPEFDPDFTVFTNDKGIPEITKHID